MDITSVSTLIYICAYSRKHMYIRVNLHTNARVFVLLVQCGWRPSEPLFDVDQNYVYIYKVYFLFFSKYMDDTCI